MRCGTGPCDPLRETFCVWARIGLCINSVVMDEWFPKGTEYAVGTFYSPPLILPSFEDNLELKGAVPDVKFFSSDGPKWFGA
jgi:hypothetical protein